MEYGIGTKMNKTGLAAIAAAGFFLMAAADANACSAAQKSGNLTAQQASNMALARLRVLPPEKGAQPEDVVPANPPTIVGLWDVQFFGGGQLLFETYDMWHADGTEIEVDASNPILGNVCNGVYVQTGAITYRLTHPSWVFDANGNLTNTVMIREVVTLDLNGQKYSGTFTVDYFDLNGKLVEHDEGTLKATRVKPV